MKKTTRWEKEGEETNRKRNREKESIRVQG